MVKAAPAATLVVAEAEFLLQLLIVAFDPPAQLGRIDQIAEPVSSGSVESQYLVGIASPFGHSIRHHSSGRGWCGCNRDARAGPARQQSERPGGVGAFAPGDPTPGSLRQFHRQLLDGHWRPGDAATGACLHPCRLIRAAIGSTLFRGPGSNSPVQYDRNGLARSACPSAAVSASTYAEHPGRLSGSAGPETHTPPPRVRISMPDKPASKWARYL